MTPEIFRRLAYRCYLSFRFTSYLESNRNPFLIVSQFPTIESASMDRCEFDAMLIAKALSNLMFRDRLMSDPPEEVYPSTDLFKLPSPCRSRHQPVPYRAKQCNGRGHLQLRTSNKENIQSVAKLSLSFADLLRSKR